MKLLLLAFALPLLAQAASLRGTVRHANTREPLERVLIRLVAADGKAFEERTGSDGRFSFPELPGARFTLMAVAEEFLPLQPIALSLANTDDRRDLELQMSPQLRLTGRVLKAVDEPASAVTVQARQNGVEVATDWTDSQGMFRLTGLHPGTYQIVATRGITWEPTRVAGGREMFAFTEHPQPMTLAVGEKEQKIDVMLRRVPVHRIRLKTDGKLATLTPVSAPPPQNVYDITNREVPADGCLSLVDVFAGTYSLVVDGGAPQEITVPSRPGC